MRVRSASALIERCAQGERETRSPLTRRRVFSICAQIFIGDNYKSARKLLFLSLPPLISYTRALLRACIWIHEYSSLREGGRVDDEREEEREGKKGRQRRGAPIYLCGEGRVDVGLPG